MEKRKMIWIPDDLHQEVKIQAAVEKKSMGETITKIIKFYLKNNKKK